MNEDGAALLAIIAGREPLGFYDVRTLLPSADPAQRFFPLKWAEPALAYIAAQSRRGDVYVGAAPRNARRGTKEYVPRAWCLWVDCDSPEASERLARFEHPPTLTIDSGTPGNTHAWWSLPAPVPAAWAERANRRLALHLGADPKCAEIARVLRPPGTMNHKHDPPAPVVVSGRHGKRYELTELVSDLLDPKPKPKPKPTQASPPRAPSGPDALLGISAREYVPRLCGREPNARGKVPCPFHGDWEGDGGSLHVYADPAQGWHCFGCDEGGSIYQFAALLWGMDDRGQGFLRLRARLCEEFGV